MMDETKPPARVGPAINDLASMKEAYKAAKMGSDALLAAYIRYFEKHVKGWKGKKK